jgi:endonuclease YncB( thermonuclease family)
LKGIDAPAMKPNKEVPDREAVVSKALQSKKMLSTMIGNRVVRMVIHDFDKYGRFLATVYQRGSCMGVDININEYMLNGGYGVKSAAKKYRPSSSDDQEYGNSGQSNPSAPGHRRRSSN